jgi:hypothetical protein
MGDFGCNVGRRWSLPHDDPAHRSCRGPPLRLPDEAVPDFPGRAKLHTDTLIREAVVWGGSKRVLA